MERVALLSYHSDDDTFIYKERRARKRAHPYFKEYSETRTSVLFVGSLTICLSIWFLIVYELGTSKGSSSECWDVLDDCEGVPFEDTVLPPFYDYLQEFVVSPRYGISQCLIPKVLSTIGTAALCYLDDPNAFQNANRSISTEGYMDRFCPENQRNTYGKVKELSNVIIVRDPFDRFISGFVEKCVENPKHEASCLSCAGDVRCFLRKEFRRLKRISMLFPVYTVADTHFAPQTWFCDMKNSLPSSTLIKYGNTAEERKVMIDQLEQVYRARNVSQEELDEVRFELSGGKSIHSTAGGEHRKKYDRLVRGDQQIRRAIIRMYFYDFLIFNFQIAA